MSIPIFHHGIARANFSHDIWGGGVSESLFCLLACVCNLMNAWHLQKPEESTGLSELQLEPVVSHQVGAENET